jgi:hypothetical protein
MKGLLEMHFGLNLSLLIQNILSISQKKKKSIYKIKKKKKERKEEDCPNKSFSLLFYFHLRKKKKNHLTELSLPILRTSNMIDHYIFHKYKSGHLLSILGQWIVAVQPLLKCGL